MCYLAEKNTCSRSEICVLYLERIRVPGQEYVFFIWKIYVVQDMNVCSLSGRNMCYVSRRNMYSLSGRNMCSVVRNVYSLSEVNLCSRLALCVLYLDGKCFFFQEGICVPKSKMCVLYLEGIYVPGRQCVLCSVFGRNRCSLSGRNLSGQEFHAFCIWKVCS